MSDANLAQLTIARESSFGTAKPITTFQRMRFTKEALGYDKATAVSGEIRPDRQVADELQVGVDIKGTLDFEFSALTFDALLEAALCGDFSTPATGTITITAVAANDAVTVAGFTYTFVASITANNQVLIGATAQDSAQNLCAALNQDVTLAGALFSSNILTNASAVEAEMTGTGIVTVRAIVAGTGGNALGLSKTGTGTAVSGANLTGGIASLTLVQGRRRKSFILDKMLAVGQYQSFNGVTVDQLSLTINSKQIITGQFTFVGRAGTTSGASFASPTLPDAATTTQVMTASANVAAITAGGLPVGGGVKSLSLQINNNIRAHDVVGSLYAAGVGLGSIGITGKINAYFTDRSLMAKYIAHQTVSISFALSDGVNTYTVTMPRCQLKNTRPEVSGKDTDIMLPLDFTALANDGGVGTLANCIQIVKS